jgi:hypothetical protein
MMQLHPTNARLSLKIFLNFALTYYTNKSDLRQEIKMNCNFCGCDGAYVAHKVKRKIVVICGDCWYQEIKYALRQGIK